MPAVMPAAFPMFTVCRASLGAVLCLTANWKGSRAGAFDTERLHRVISRHLFERTVAETVRWHVEAAQAGVADFTRAQIRNYLAEAAAARQVRAP